MAIDVGSACIDRNEIDGPNYTVIDENNPANATGTIDYITVHAAAGGMGGIQFGIFIHGGSNAFTLRDFDESPGKNTANGCEEFNAPGDFTAFSINTGDYIGIYWTTGSIEKATNGGDGQWWKNGDCIYSGLSETFNHSTPRITNIYGTGTEAGGVTMPIFMSNHLRQMGA